MPARSSACSSPSGSRSARHPPMPPGDPRPGRRRVHPASVRPDAPQPGRAGPRRTARRRGLRRRHRGDQRQDVAAQPQRTRAPTSPASSTWPPAPAAMPTCPTPSAPPTWRCPTSTARPTSSPSCASAGVGRPPLGRAPAVGGANAPEHRPPSRTHPVPIIHAIVLGLVQGLSEFLPISSSGHLLLVPWLFGWNDFDNASIEKAFDVALHLGTLVAVVGYFRHELVVYVREGVRLVVQREKPVTPRGPAGVAAGAVVDPGGRRGRGVREDHRREAGHAACSSPCR